MGEPGGPSGEPGGGGVVVYIEDNPANLLVIQRLLQRRPGIELVTATTGAEGVEAVRDRCPDLVLLDVHLPDLDGGQVLARLRADPATAGIPVVALSADATAEQIRAVLDGGADGYLTKPLDLRNVLEVVDTHVGHG